MSKLNIVDLYYYEHYLVSSNKMITNMLQYVIYYTDNVMLKNHNVV